MKDINELQDEVIEEFSDFEDWMDKYQLLIDLGKPTTMTGHCGSPQRATH